MPVPLDELRTLMAIALAGLLLLLRLDAPRFSGAEYDMEPSAYDEEPPGVSIGDLAVRTAWPGLAIVLTAGVALLLPAGRGAIGLGASTLLSSATIVWIVLGSAVGIGAVLGLAAIRSPGWPPRLNPRAVAPRHAFDAVATAIVDELTFRGVLLGLLLLAGLPVWIAFLVQLVVYGIETRLGRYAVTLGLLAEALALGALTGVLAVATGGVAAPLVAHAVIRFAALDVEGALPPIVPRRFA